MKRGDTIRLRVDGLAFGGEAVGRSDEGRVVFVAGAAPGDVVDVTLDEVKKGFARGRLSSLRERGAARVEPVCPLVPVCGGCQWQEVSIEEQRRAKQAIVARALGRLGCEVAPLVAPTAPFRYRTRARLTVGLGGPGGAGDTGGLRVGFHGRRSHEIVEVLSVPCPLLDGALARALTVAREALGPHLPVDSTLEGLVGARGVHLAVTLPRGARPTPALDERAAALVGREGILGVVVDGDSDGDRGPRRVHGAATVDTAEPGEPPFHAAADGFAQASHDGNRALRRLALAEARALLDGVKTPRVLELHAGDGNFTRDLATLAAHVETVEVAARAVERARSNVPSAVAHATPVERDVARRVAAAERWDLILLDPPREGAREIVDAIARLTDRVVYVSCDPMTLARDAAALAAHGLRPLRATPVDLMPQTFHVETVCALMRRS